MSSDGHVMLYASFNDSLVEEMHISWFGEDNKALYPDIRSLRYPKVRYERHLRHAFEISRCFTVKPDFSLAVRQDLYPEIISFSSLERRILWYDCTLPI